MPDLSSRYDHSNELRRLLHQDQYHATISIVPVGNFVGDPSSSDDTLICYGAFLGIVDKVFELCEGRVEENIEEELRWYAFTTLCWIQHYVQYPSVSRVMEVSTRRELGKFAATMFRSLNENGSLASDETCLRYLGDLFAVITLQSHEQSSNTPVMRKVLGLLNSAEYDWLRPQSLLFTNLQTVLLFPSQIRERTAQLRDLCRTNLAGCRFFISVDDLPGLGPADTMPKDWVTLLIGGRVPYILRRHSRHSHKNSAGRQYNFVGECYVHGAMQGEMKLTGVGPATIYIR